MEGWVDFGYPAVEGPRVEQATSRSQVGRPNHYTTKPSCLAYTAKCFHTCDFNAVDSVETSRASVRITVLSKLRSHCINATVFHQTISISCRFRDCKARLVTTQSNHASCPVTRLQTFSFSCNFYLATIPYLWTRDNIRVRPIKPDIGVTHLQCESKNAPPPLKFSDIFPKRLGIFSPRFTRLLHIPVHAGLQFFLFNYLQLWWSYAILKRNHHNVLKISTIDRNARWMVALNTDRIKDTHK